MEMPPTQQQVQSILTWLLRLEDRNLSGVTIDEGDGAGLTRFGITQVYDKQFVPLVFWSTDATTAFTMAQQFYRVRFWDRLQLDSIIDLTLAASLLSCAVNDGMITAVKLLQQAVGVTVDGALGPTTLTAANAQPNAESQFIDAWVARYYAIIRADVSREKFIVGWVRRARAVYPMLPS